MESSTSASVAWAGSAPAFPARMHAARAFANTARQLGVSTILQVFLCLKFVRQFFVSFHPFVNRSSTSLTARMSKSSGTPKQPGLFLGSQPSLMQIVFRASEYR